MKKVLFDERIEIKLHNKREDDLYSILMMKLNECKRYYNEDTFGKTTIRVVEREMSEINGILSSMFYMGLIEEPTSVNDIIWCKENHLFAI